jgi:hypothetical protein
MIAYIMGDIPYDEVHETMLLEPNGIKPRRNWLILLYFLRLLTAHSNLLTVTRYNIHRVYSVCIE